MTVCNESSSADPEATNHQHNKNILAQSAKQPFYWLAYGQLLPDWSENPSRDTWSCQVIVEHSHTGLPVGVETLLLAAQEGGGQAWHDVLVVVQLSVDNQQL